MKSLITSLLFLSFITAQCQLGLKAGVNASWFTQGDPVIKGMTNIQAGFAGGFYDNIHLNKHWSIQPELIYERMGSRTPDVDNRNYCPYYISLPVTLKYNVGMLSIGAGGYISRMIFAKNYSFEGDVSGWAVNKWRYMKRYDEGVKVVLAFDFVACRLSFEHDRGLRTVRGKENSNDRYRGCYNSSFGAMLSVPLNTFK